MTAAVGALPIVPDRDLKCEYQEWLEEHNCGRASSDDRPLAIPAVEHAKTAVINT